MITLRGRVIARQEANPHQGVPALCTVRFFIGEYKSTDLVLENRKDWELDDEVTCEVRLTKEKPTLVASGVVS